MATYANETDTVAIVNELVDNISTNSMSRESQMKLLRQMAPLAAYPQCTSTVSAAMLMIVGNILRRSAGLPRDMLLVEVMQLLPFIRNLLDDRAIVKIGESIREVGTWWQ